VSMRYSIPVEVDRVFGHMDIEVDMVDGRARAEFRTTQPIRLFEKFTVGRSFQEVPYIAARICGACSISHQTAALLAVEDALGVEPDEKASAYRDLAHLLEVAQNQLVHLYFLMLPDLLGVRDLEDLTSGHPDIVKMAVNLNTMLNQAVNAVEGKLVQPHTFIIGGAARAPGKAKLLKAARILEAVERQCLDAARFILDHSSYVELEDPMPLYAVLDMERGFLAPSRKIRLSDGSAFRVDDYPSHVAESRPEYSNSKAALVNGKPVYVGARARYNAYMGPLRSIADELGLKGPLGNPMDNVKAKALEMIYAVRESINLARSLAEMGPPRRGEEVRPRGGEGFGAIEAPRGILIHHYRLDENGRVTYANVITPTVFNARHAELSAERLVQALLERGVSDAATIERSALALIRSYDPCLPCAVHVTVLRGEKR